MVDSDDRDGDGIIVLACVVQPTALSVQSVKFSCQHQRSDFKIDVEACQQTANVYKNIL